MVPDTDSGVADAGSVTRPGLDEVLGWIAPRLEAAGACGIVDSGSLLGLAREGRTLAGDGDFDLALPVTSADRLTRLIDDLRGAGAKVWRYDGRVYKLELSAAQTGLAVDIDIKCFRRTAAGWVCPSVWPVWSAVGSDSVPAGGETSFLRRHLRPGWRRVLARADATRWPGRVFLRADAWVVPHAWFDELGELPGYPGCHVPADVDGYLSFRYGDWRKPVADWCYWRDDGAYRSLRGVPAGAPDENPLELIG